MIQEQRRDEQEEQIEREFGKEEFVTVVGELLSSMKIFQNVDLYEIYERIQKQRGKVIGRDILSTVQQLQSKAEDKKIINEQIAYYKKQINKLMKNGISCITSLEFEEILQRHHPSGVITIQIKKQTKNLDYISLVKLMNAINKIQEVNNEGMKQKIVIGSLYKSSIFESEDFEEMPQINVNLVINYVKESVFDAGVRNNLEALLKQIDKKIHDLEYSYSQLKEVQNTLRKNLDEFDDELYKSSQVMDQKQSEIARLRTKVKQFEEDVLSLNKKYQDEIVNHVQNVEKENDNLRKEIVNLSVQNEELSSKVNWFKANYEGLTKQYQQFIEEMKTNEEKEKKEKQEKMFIQRTIKEQLEDALAKISMLRAENSGLKQKNSDIVFEYENKISILEQRIKQIQEQKLSHGISRFYENGADIRNSRLDVSNNHNRLCPSTVVGSFITQLKRRSSQLQLPESVIFGLRPYENGFKKKKQVISIQVSQAFSQVDKDENAHEASFANQMPQENQEGILKEQPKINEQAKIKRKKFLSFILLSDNTKYFSHIIASQDKFSFYDSKMRKNYSIKFNQLRKIIFCHHNITWIVLKVKSNQTNEKNQTLYDTVLSITNRADLLEFLHVRSSRKLLQAGVKVQFEKEDRIWVNLGSQILLSNFNNYYNLYRISISNAGNLFLASMEENSWFNLASDVILIVTSIGILVFQRYGDDLLEINQKLLNIIPIVELMEVQNPTQYKLVIKYKTDKKVYKMKLNSVTMAKKLKYLIEEERKMSIMKKEQEVKKYRLFTSVVNKNGKVDQSHATNKNNK